MVEFGAAMAGVILVTVNPGLRSGEARICPEAVARGGRHGGHRNSAAIRCWRPFRRSPPAVPNCARSSASIDGMSFWHRATLQTPSFPWCDRPMP